MLSYDTYENKMKICRLTCVSRIIKLANQFQYYIRDTFHSLCVRFLLESVPPNTDLLSLVY